MGSELAQPPSALLFGQISLCSPPQAFRAVTTSRAGRRSRLGVSAPVTQPQAQSAFTVSLLPQSAIPTHPYQGRKDREETRGPGVFIKAALPGRAPCAANPEDAPAAAAEEAAGTAGRAPHVPAGRRRSRESSPPLAPPPSAPASRRAGPSAAR